MNTNNYLINKILSYDMTTIDKALNNMIGYSDYTYLEDYLKTWSIEDLKSLLKECKGVYYNE